MASNLEFIGKFEVTGTVQTLDCDNVFSDAYKSYFIKVSFYLFELTVLARLHCKITAIPTILSYTENLKCNKRTISGILTYSVSQIKL